MNKNKFVIVTSQRSGSNMLVSMIDSHPQIRCFGELMRVTPDWMKRDGYRGVLRMLEKVDPVYRDDTFRFAHSHDFVNAVFSLAPNRQLYGFLFFVVTMSKMGRKNSLFEKTGMFHYKKQACFL